MIDGFRAWDIQPELVEHNEVTLPSDLSEERVGREWCELVNYLYKDKGYWTSVLASQCLVSTHISRAYKQQILVANPDFGETHYLYGFLKRVEMGPPLGRFGVEAALQYEPFVYLDDAQDVTAGNLLGAAPRQHIKVPLLPHNGGLVLDLGVRSDRTD